MELIALMGASITVAFIGFNVLYLIIGRFDKLCASEMIFISYAIGAGLISLEMLIFYLCGLGFSISGLLLPWAILLAMNILRYSRSGYRFTFLTQFSASRPRHCEAAKLPKQSQPPSEIASSLTSFVPRNDALLSVFLSFGISLEVVYAFFRALIKPIEAYDAIAIYAIKSKIFFLAKAIPQTYFSGLSNSFPHPDYPLNIPLIETFMYMAMGSLNDQLVKIIFPLFFLGILCVLYCAIRRFASRAYALLFTFVLASIPQFNAYAANAYQELPLAFYYFVSAIFLFAWIEDKKSLRYLVISALMAALAGWTKNEGLLYCAINVSLVLVFSVLGRQGASRKTVYALLLYMAIIGAVLAPWILIKQRFGIVNDEINLHNLSPAYLSKQIYKLGPIFYELQKQLFGPKKWILLWPAAIAVAILNYKKMLSGINRYISISIALAFCGYVLFYMISYVDVVFFASKTWSRFLLHFLPLLVLWLAYMLKEDIKI